MDSRKWLVLLVTLGVGATVSIKAVEVTNCAVGEEVVAILQSVAIKGCDMKRDEACNFKRGTDANIKIDFIASK